MNPRQVDSMHTSQDLRRVNRQNLLRLIYFNEPISRLELSQLSGFSPATVSNLVSNLLEQNLIMQAGFEESQGGRPRESLRINPDYGYFIGVEVAETHIYSELFNIRLKPIADVRYEISPDENSPDAIVDYIVNGIRYVQAQASVSNDEILAAGIGLPGIVNRVGGVSVFAPNWGWSNIPLLHLLRHKLDINFQLDSGRQALALAEARFGAGRGASELAVLLIGTGVGAGVISQGRLLRGITNSAGEWGHTCVDITGPACRCGGYGCVEAFVGAPGIIRQLHEIAPTSPLLQVSSQKGIVRALRDAALEGDSVAVKVMDGVTRWLGVGIANLVNLVNPERIIIGGWCGALLNPYILPRLPRLISHYALDEPAAAVEILPTELELEGVSLGAASLVLETFLTGELHAPSHTPVGGGYRIDRV
jgi:predicted NBD/HSP70 family sugar kinase